MTVIILHGLEGSSLSQYVIGTGSKAWESGMNVVRMNMRNCGGTHLLGPTLYNSSMSSDVGAVMRRKVTPKLALLGHKIPKQDLKAVKEIYKTADDPEHRVELNLYVTGYEDEPEPHAEGAEGREPSEEQSAPDTETQS